MGSYYNIKRALLQPLYSLTLLSWCSKTGKHINTYRKIHHPLYKSIIVLLGKNSGGYQKNYLLTIRYSLKGSTNCNLCLTITNITANQAIHNPATFHILLGGLNSMKLIICLLIGKCFFKLLLPYRIRTILKSFLLLSYGI